MTERMTGRRAGTLTRQYLKEAGIPFEKVAVQSLYIGIFAKIEGIVLTDFDQWLALDRFGKDNGFYAEVETGSIGGRKIIGTHYDSATRKFGFITVAADGGLGA